MSSLASCHKVIIIVGIQAIVGLFAKVSKTPPFSYVVLQAKRNKRRLFHVFLGIISMAMLWVQVWTGFTECT